MVQGKPNTKYVNVLGIFKIFVLHQQLTPKANVDVQRPEIRPYVSIPSGNPYSLKKEKTTKFWQTMPWDTYTADFNASEKLDTRTAAIPNPWQTNPLMTSGRVLQQLYIFSYYAFYETTNLRFGWNERCWSK